MADVRLTATNPEDSSVVPVACDASGRLLLEEMPPAFDGTLDGDLYVTGKGTFAGGKSIIGNDGSAQFAQGAVDIYANGTVEFTQNVTFDSSAAFGGDLTVDGTSTFNGPGTYNAVFKVSDTTGGRNVTTGLCRSNSGESYGLTIAPADNENNFSAFIKADGSAQFARGLLEITDNGSSYGRSFISNNADVTSFIAYAKNNAPNKKAFNVYNTDTVSNIVSIKADGSATFAGNKAGFTAEGYLWCTTRRGDTVILDATSNGLASWVEYTPTSRIDDLRDKLDANRGDKGEMPADTP